MTAMNSLLIEAIANAIQAQEGYYIGSRAYRNQNPGNLWDGLIPGVKVKRIWPEYPIDDEGFLKLPDYDTGRRLMVGQIRLKIARGENLTRLINEWDSSDPAATRTLYVSHVSQATGIDPTVPLNALSYTPRKGPTNA